MSKKAAAETGLNIIPKGGASKALVPIAAGAEFTESQPSVYAGEIKRLADEAKAAGANYAVKTILLGRYCREVHLAMMIKGEKGFQAWLEEAVPELSYNSISVAMRAARMISDQHPELRRLDSEKKVEALTRLIDGRTFTTFAQDMGVISRPANVGADGKRIHTPSTKNPVLKAEELETQRRRNFLEAIQRLEIEIKQGNYGAISDQELGEVIHALTDMTKQLRDIAAARTTGKAPAPTRKPRDIKDL